MNYQGRKRKYQIHNRQDAFKKPRQEFKTFAIIDRVRSQTGFRGDLVLFHSELEGPLSILRNAVDRVNAVFNIRNVDCSSQVKKDTCKFQLLINNELICEGSYHSESEAKKSLAELAVVNLQKTCFTIFRKIHPRDSPKIDLNVSTTHNSVPETSSSNIGGIGAKMMLQMGWSGGGLGAQEQGRTNIVQPYLQIERQGFGSKNIVSEVTKVLRQYASSKNINSIAFSPDFTKEERAVIHQVAQKLNLKSRSYGNSTDRILVVTSKIKPWDLIHSLLEAGGENEQFKLILPSDFDN